MMSQTFGLCDSDNVSDDDNDGKDNDDEWR